MKKYKIYLGGYGAEVYIHNINDEQKSKLKDIDIENTEKEVDWDALNEILNVDSLDYGDVTYTGSDTDSDSLNVRVMDMNNELIWSSDENTEFEPSEDEDYVNKEYENILMVVHQMKGEFKSYVIESEEDFNPEKLTPEITEINEAIQIITGLRYDGKKLEVDDWEDSWTKNIVLWLF
jgi:hypothetical protein